MSGNWLSLGMTGFGFGMLGVAIAKIFGVLSAEVHRTLLGILAVGLIGFGGASSWSSHQRDVAAASLQARLSGAEERYRSLKDRADKHTGGSEAPALLEALTKETGALQAANKAAKLANETRDFVLFLCVFGLALVVAPLAYWIFVIGVRQP